MDIKEFEGVLEEATKGLKSELADAKEKAADALNKFEEIKSELEKSASKEMLDAMEMRVKALQDMADTMAVKLQNRGGSGPETKKTLIGQFADDYKAKFAALKAVDESGSGKVVLHAKDAVTGLSVFGDNVIRGLREAGIDTVPFRENAAILGLIQTINGGIGSNPLSWIEQRQVSGEGIADSPAWTAESAIKPVMKWEWVENEVLARMLPATAYITRQALLNWGILQNTIQNELIRELVDYWVNSIINGTGSGQEIFGVKHYAKPFNVGEIEAISNPYDVDVLRAAISQVKRGGAPTDRKRGGFNPNAILVSVDRGANIDMDRSASDGHYVLPPFVSNDNTVIKGVRVIETNFLTGDEFIVGDFSRYLFNIVDGIKVEMGYIDKQFVQNQVTLRAEMYGMGRVKANEAFAFSKGTFTAAKAALIAGPST
jgi:HK97 family phage major capsid protein